MKPQSSGTSSIIFHHPGPVAEDFSAGSKVRPARLLKAFRDQGFEVATVTGYSRERLKMADRLTKDLQAGRHFDFVYSESRSIPTLLSDPHRLPLHPWLDARFLHTMRGSGVPTGLFYRDIYWRFDVYRQMLAAPFRWLTIPLYHYDWHWYRQCIQHLFLPSEAMARHLPSHWPSDNCSALPPGATPNLSAENRTSSAKQGVVRMTYVGGIQPPLYDITALLQLAGSNRRTMLTLCCRKTEWQKLKNHYQPLLNDRIKVVHASGTQLDAIYAQTDLFAMLREPHEYLDFAAPVKLFEAFGRGLPVLCFKGNEAARIIEQEGAGWAIHNLQEAGQLIDFLAQNPDTLKIKSAATLAAAERHSWNVRVQEIGRQLRRYRGKK